jgi:phosphoribosylformimino-5-aminoimidazole carboxamide ribotide isomerase
VAALERLLDLTDLPVIAAGGVATLDDVTALYPLHAKGLAGVVTGRAIYAGTLDFKAALDWIERQ